jgi:hypothetical protein
MSFGDFLYWVRNHKSSVAGILIVVAGCFALVHLSRRVHHLQPRAGMAASAAADAATARNAGADLTPSDARGKEQSGRSAKMRGEFESATGYLDFIQQAMSRPQEGGKFYAMLAWKRCNDVARQRGGSPVHVGEDAVYEAAAALVEDVAKRCAGVLDTYPSAQSVYDVAMDQRGGKDLLVPVDGRGIVSPTGRATAGADIDAALRSGDRRAAAEALQSNAEFVDAGSPSGDDGADRQLHELGAEIVGCELIGDCRGGVRSALHCVGTGDCTHEDWRDVIRSQVPEASQGALDAVVSGMRQRMGLAPGRS